MKKKGERVVIWSAILLAWATIAFGASGIINTNNDVTLSNSIALIIKANPGRKTVALPGTQAAPTRRGSAMRTRARRRALTLAVRAVCSSSLCFDNCCGEFLTAT